MTPRTAGSFTGSPALSAAKPGAAVPMGASTRVSLRSNTGLLHADVAIAGCDRARVRPRVRPGRQPVAASRRARLLPVLDRRRERHLRLHRLRYTGRWRLRIGRAPVVERVSAGIARAKPSSLRIGRLRARRAPASRARMGAAPLRAFPPVFVDDRRGGAVARVRIGDRRLLARMGSARAIQPGRDRRMARRAAGVRRRAHPQFHRHRRGQRPAVLAAHLPAHRHPARAARRHVDARAAAVAAGDVPAADARLGNARCADVAFALCARSRAPRRPTLARPPASWHSTGSISAFTRSPTRRPPPRSGLGAGGFTLLLLALPWVSRAARTPRPAAAVVDLANCNGCGRCVRRLPLRRGHDAVAHRRQDGVAAGRGRSGPVRRLRHLRGRVPVVDAVSRGCRPRDRHRHAARVDCRTAHAPRRGTRLNRRDSRRSAVTRHHRLRL